MSQLQEDTNLDISGDISQNICERFIESITPYAMKYGVTKIALHGEHDADLENVDALLATRKLSAFYNKAFKDVVWQAYKHKVWGAVIAKKESEFEDFCDRWDTDGISLWNKKGDRFVRSS